MRRMRVADAVRELSRGQGGEGEVRLCASVGVMPSCLPCGDSELFGRHLFERPSCWARGGLGREELRRCREVLDGHHSMVMETFLEMDRICVSVVQNSREKDCP